MKRLSYEIVDVFTDTPYNGNPLAICLIPPDDDIPTQTLQSIASEFNLSETVFLRALRAGDEVNSTWTARIFTPGLELTFAGHPIIGTTFHILRDFIQLQNTVISTPKKLQSQAVATIKCGAGTVAVSMDEKGVSSAVIPHNYHLHAARVSMKAIETLQPGLLDHKDSIISTNVLSPVRGMNFLTTQLVSMEALSSIKTTGTKPLVTLDDGWNTGLLGTAYYVALGEHEGVSRYRTRMIETTIEDPATGSMSCALAMHLTLASGQHEKSFEFIQGVEMARESHIGVQVFLEHDKVSKVILKGQAVKIMEGSLLY